MWKVQEWILGQLNLPHSVQPVGTVANPKPLRHNEEETLTQEYFYPWMSVKAAENRERTPGQREASLRPFSPPLHLPHSQAPRQLTGQESPREVWKAAAWLSNRSKLVARGGWGGRARRVNLFFFFNQFKGLLLTNWSALYNQWAGFLIKLVSCCNFHGSFWLLSERWCFSRTCVVPCTGLREERLLLRVWTNAFNNSFLQVSGGRLAGPGE